MFQPDIGKSFKQLREGFGNGTFKKGISDPGLTNALHALESEGLIEKTTATDRAKGARANYRITRRLAVEELIISDVVSFLRAEEPAQRWYTGVPWMGLVSSSDERFGRVLNEDQDYNEKFLQLFLLVHDKWRSHIIRREYEDKGRTRELGIVREYEDRLLECLRLYKAPILWPFTGKTIVIDEVRLLRYNILEQSQMTRGIVHRSKKHFSYCDFLLRWMRLMEEKGYASKAAQRAARSHKAFLHDKPKKRAYESFLSRIVPPQSVLFMPFSFSFPVQQSAELMAQFKEALRPSKPSS